MFFIRRKYFVLPFFIVLLSFSVFSQTPTPTPVPEETPEVVYTDEIKVNISAFDLDGNFADSLKKDDVIILEDGRIHQANLIEHTPAKVLILLDTGGENRVAKDFKSTKLAAKGLINSLQKDDQIALMAYHDKVELISDWSSDKSLLLDALDKKTNLGKRSRFTDGINQATDFLLKLKSENRHLLLITDGLESVSNQEQKNIAIRRLTATNINVHVLSYTGLEQQVVKLRKKSIRGGGRRAIELPPGADIPGKVATVPIVTINTDRAMVKKNEENGQALARSERELIRLADDTNGVFYLPADIDELVGKAGAIAKNIDSQYVVTYTPKRPLNESPNGEVRTIEVTSRRDKVVIQAKRRFLVIK